MSRPEIAEVLVPPDGAALAAARIPTAPSGMPALRAMTPADTDALTAIEVDSYPLDPWPAAAFDAAAGSPHTYVSRVAVEPAGAVIGYAVVLLAADQAELHNLTVRADHRRRGLARRLLDDVLSEVSRRGAGEVFLEVQHDNEPAIALYTAYGFTVVGRRRNYYARGVDAVLMRRVLTAAPDDGDDR